MDVACGGLLADVEKNGRYTMAYQKDQESDS